MRSSLRHRCLGPSTALITVDAGGDLLEVVARVRSLAERLRELAFVEEVVPAFGELAVTLRSPAYESRLGGWLAAWGSPQDGESAATSPAGLASAPAADTSLVWDPWPGPRPLPQNPPPVRALPQNPSPVRALPQNATPAASGSLPQNATRAHRPRATDRGLGSGEAHGPVPAVGEGGRGDRRGPGDAAAPPTAERRHVIRVRYDGPDLPAVARALSLTEAEVVRRHTAQAYRVLAIGFQPGFAYLGQVPPGLRLPRRTSPRPRVSPGSVAIAADLTAVYPFASPGGWHLIGRTDHPLVDPGTAAVTMLGVGEVVTFVDAAAPG